MCASKAKHGLAHIDVSTYQGFSKYVGSLGSPFVFRGQGCDWWDLRPSLANFFNKCESGLLPQQAYDLTKTHFQRFREGLSKRINEVPFLKGCDPTKLDDLDLWAIGRHYGLPTPILDWTGDPFIAAFFAFYQGRECKEDKTYPWRAVWAADRELVKPKLSGV